MRLGFRFELEGDGDAPHELLVRPLAVKLWETKTGKKLSAGLGMVDLLNLLGTQLRLDHDPLGDDQDELERRLLSLESIELAGAPGVPPTNAGP